MGNDLELKRDIDRVTKKLKGLLKEFDSKNTRQILRRASRPTRKAARSNIKDAKQLVKRYSTPKLVKGIRAPKGKGRVVAIYHPGNLRRSIAIMTFRRARFAVFVGPRIGKGAGAKEYGKAGMKVDGYYAHMVEKGTINQSGQHYMKRAYSRTKGQVVAIATEQSRKRINQYKRKVRL